MTKANERALRSAWTRFDRLTAYGCRQRGLDFDQGKCREAWADYQALLTSVFATPTSPYPGDTGGALDAFPV